MTLLDLRKVFGYNVDIYLKQGDNWFLIGSVLWGTVSFTGMQVNDIKIIYGKVMVDTLDMPTEVYQAWKKYNERG